MLVLARKAEQAVVFPDLGISVRFLELNGKVVKVGVEAPPSVTVVRGELMAKAASSDAGHDSVEQAYADTLVRLRRLERRLRDRDDGEAERCHRRLLQAIGILEDGAGEDGVWPHTAAPREAQSVSEPPAEYCLARSNKQECACHAA